MAALVAGILMAARGQWGATVIAVPVAGALTWVAGAWVLPGGEDAYLMRVRRSVRHGADKIAGSYETFERYARRQRSRLDRLQPPAGLEQGHARLIELLRQADSAAGDPSLSPKTRAADVARSLKRAREQRTILLNESAGAASGRYAKSLEDIAASSQALMEGAFGRAEEVVEAMVDRLERAQAPGRLAARHKTLVEDSHRYLQAMRAYHDAVRELDPERVAAAVEACELARARIKGAAHWEET